MRIVRWAMFAMYILFLVLACLLWWFAGTEDGRTLFAAKFQILDFWGSTMAVITVPLLLVFAADTYLEYCLGCLPVFHGAAPGRAASTASKALQCDI